MIAPDTTLFRQILAEAGYHVTQARLTTFELLGMPEPQSMHQIISRGAGRLDRVSIYRNIELFEKLGIVRRIPIGWKYKLELSDRFVAHHHHLTCISCGAVTDIKDEEHIDAFISTVAASAGFRPLRHQFEIEGHCRQCSAQAALSNNT